MRSTLCSAMLAILLCLGLVLAAGCGDDDDSGAPGTICTPTQQGASMCQYNVCLAGVQCQNGKTFNVCAGPSCTGSGTCPTGQQCVPVSGTSQSYCVPLSVCQ